jgi:hypothetical protein
LLGIKERVGVVGGIKLETKQEFFDFEKEERVVADELYQLHNWEIDRSGACEGFDLVLNIKGEKIKVEEKFRSGIWEDILVEKTQDTKTESTGWYYYSTADVIVYFMKSNAERRVYIISFFKLRELIDRIMDSLQTKISKKGWGITVNWVVPLSLLQDRGVIRRLV